MKFKKIPYIIVLCLMLLLLMSGCGSMAEPQYALISTGNTSADGMFTYDVYENRTAVITGGTANDICLTIPDMIDGYPVVEIGESAFAGDTDFRYVILGENVRTLAFSAFNECQGLIRVDATPALRIIDNSVFAGCTALCELTGATKLESIGESAFFQCISLVEAPLSESLTVLGAQAFYGCSSLTEINLPSKLTALQDGAFGFCTSLARVNLGNVSVIADNAFQKCTSLCTIHIGKQVTSIGESAFRGCFMLADVTVASSVSEIGYCAFEKTAWLTAQTDEFVMLGNGVLLRYNGTATDVVLPAGVRAIADAFCDNDVIKSVTIGNKVTKIGSAAFSGCGQLSRVTVGKQVTHIADTAFAGCSALANLYLPKSLTAVGNSAFNGCSLLSTVYYAGSARDWAKISLDGGNTSLTTAQLLTGQRY